MASEAYQFEFEIKASPKVLYPYLSTASGLQQWFADKVTVKYFLGHCYLRCPSTQFHSQAKV